MARSHAIWIVTDVSYLEAPIPWAAFTVKHELQRWLRTRTDRKWLRILRYPDGRCNYEEIKEIPMSELVNTNATTSTVS
jgi:hypothetical protein